MRTALAFIAGCLCALAVLFVAVKSPERPEPLPAQQPRPVRTMPSGDPHLDQLIARSRQWEREDREQQFQQDMLDRQEEIEDRLLDLEIQQDMQSFP